MEKLLIIGDSNVHRTFKDDQTATKALKINTTLSKPSSTTSVGDILDTVNNTITAVLITSLLNQCSDAVGRKNDLDPEDKEIIEDTIRSEANAIKAFARKYNGKIITIVIPPFLRTRPVWFPTMIEEISDIYARNLGGDVKIPPDFQIDAEHLVGDGVHLGTEAQSVFRQYISTTLDKFIPGRMETDSERDMETETDQVSPIIGGANPLTTPSMTSTRSVKDRLGPRLHGSAGNSLTRSKSAKRGRATQPADLSASEDNEAPAKQLRTNSTIRNESSSDIPGWNVALNEFYERMKKKLANEVENVQKNVTKDIKKTNSKIEHILEKLDNHTRTLATMAEDADTNLNFGRRHMMVIKNSPIKVSIPKDGREKGKLILETMQTAINALPKSRKDEAIITNAFFLGNTNRPNVGDVKMVFDSHDSCREARFRIQKAVLDKHPDWEKIGIMNDPTRGTKVRINLLIAMAGKVETLPNQKCIISRFADRPMMQFIQAGKIIWEKNYVQAVMEYGSLLTNDELNRAASIAGSEFTGRLENTFLILLDKEKTDLPEPRENDPRAAVFTPGPSRGRGTGRGGKGTRGGK